MKKLLLAIFLLAGIKGNAQISNDMEVWQNFSAGFPSQQLEKPLGWRGLDSFAALLIPIVFQGETFEKQLFKTTDRHSGNFAAGMVTRIYDSLPLPGIMTNANIEIDFASIADFDAEDITLSGGEPTDNQVIQYVNAWVKYVPRGNDSAAISATALVAGAGANGNDSIVGMGDMMISANSNYTLISVPIAYTSPVMANRIQVSFTSSAGDLPQDSSILYVDDVSYTIFPAGITNVDKNDIRCYPNPSNGILHLTSPAGQSFVWHAYNSNGQIVAEKAYTGATAINISYLPSGTYFYTITNKEGIPARNGKFILTK